MKILMMTNTYSPIVGGIEESIRSFTFEFEKLGHEVLVVAPECDGAPPDEVNVIRLRALRLFNHKNFSIALPMSSLLPELIKNFMPDIIHCHHPFWIGDIALRLSRQFCIPLVFTYHTMFEHYMHYLPIQNEGVKRFIVELFAGYANLCNQVIVPSESVRDILLERGVKAPVEVIPTGVDVKRFSSGDGNVIRKRLGIPIDAQVIGYVGRLALEKNLEFLSQSVAAYLKDEPGAHFLVGGDGPLQSMIKDIFQKEKVAQRLHLAGMLQGQDLVDCYHAMNIFSFASLSETQGIVLVEAMAAGLPVVALDAPGVREVVKDGHNGRLVAEQNQENFIEALSGCLHQSAYEFEQLKKNAQATTKEFSIDYCSNRMINIYQALKGSKYALVDQKDSPWYHLVSRLKSEWDMFGNMMHAGSAAIMDIKNLSKSAEKKPQGLFSRFQRYFSLSEWSARLLRLSRVEGVETQPGLVLIQIDGFSRSQFKEAIAHKEMLFLRSLLEKQNYRLYHHYPGLPSSTPSVQGELFYGIKQVVPAFAFFNREKCKISRMYESDSVLEVEQRMAREGQGLLEGGSSYSNIYAGGAKETHFCATSLGWDKIWKDVNFVNFIILVLTHFPSVVRMLALTLWEIVLGIGGFGLGILKGENCKKELKFIYLRALICVLLRELVTVGAKIDITRGLPIIHLNFLGYDEHAHNRGPSSSFAHWSLRGIDHAIKRIYRKALRSPRRIYDVWIYSDHGQEDTVSYAIKYNQNVQEAVAKVFQEFDSAIDPYHSLDKNGIQLHRARFLGHSLVERNMTGSHPMQGILLGDKLVVTAIGPTGNIYLPRKMAEEKMHSFARKLVDGAKIPVVLLPEGKNQVRAWNEDGESVLPQDAGKILGDNHPFLKQVTEDLISACHHPDAGDFTFLGFRPGVKTMTFPIENGSHAGPGIEETNGFALLPCDVISTQRERSYLMPMDLRVAALKFLKRYAETPFFETIKDTAGFVPQTIRVMTYNVHSCIGMDGKISPSRIARVIGRHNPDIVALQELDMGRKRTGQEDQPHLIAKELEMAYHFHPSVVIDEEHYGNAVLSRYPIELIRAGKLPGLAKNPKGEPRGIIWTVINIAGTKINFFNTHLGLFPSEGFYQTKALLSAQWISHSVCQGPIVLCGDFNALPGSALYRDIEEVLRDAQRELDDHKPQATWFSHYPVGRIDHVFVSPEIKVSHVKVSKTDLDKIASDHLPLIVDIKITNPVGKDQLSHLTIAQ